MRVRARGIGVRLGGADVLCDVDIDAPAGQVTGLLGPNGSGKSTLLRSLYRAVPTLRGSVRIGDRDVSGMPARERARAIAVMLQDAPTDVDLTVLEVVLLGRIPHRSAFGDDTREDLRIAADALHRTGVQDLSGRMMATLSGGQRQRVMLARALAQQSPVLLLDEPSNHLDIRHQLELMQLVREQRSTVVAALHDLNLALTSCDHVVVLERGRVAGQGPAREVLTPELIGRVFEVDARLLGEQDPTFAFRPLSPLRSALP